MSLMSIDARYTSLGYQQIATATLASAVGLTVPAGAKYALIQTETQGVRWRDDGTDPTASVGMPLAAGSDIWYCGPLSAIKLIRQASGAILNVAYYHESE